MYVFICLPPVCKLRRASSFSAAHRLSSWGAWAWLRCSVWDLSSLTRDRTHLPCTGRQILNPGPRGVPSPSISENHWLVSGKALEHTPRGPATPLPGGPTGTSSYVRQHTRARVFRAALVFIAPNWKRPKHPPGVECLSAARNDTGMRLNRVLPCRTAGTNLANKLLSERSQTPKTTGHAIYTAKLKARKNTLEGRAGASGSSAGGQTQRSCYHFPFLNLGGNFMGCSLCENSPSCTLNNL